MRRIGVPVLPSAMTLGCGPSADRARPTVRAVWLKSECESQGKTTVVCGNAVFGPAAGTWRFVAIGAK